ncbi:MAG: ABC transporter permease [Nitrospiraceae bacterium]
MITSLQFLFRHRRILWSTTVNDIRGRYAGTVLGIAWTVLYPLLFLGLYVVVYTMIFKIRIGGVTNFEYVLLIFSGLIPFFGLSEALGIGVGSVLSNRGLIKNTLFPIELIPVKAVLVGSLSMLIGLTLLLILLWVRGTVHLSQLFTPAILALQILFTIGLIWPLSALNVFLRDLGQVTSVMVLFLMLVSPIAYTVDMVPSELMPYMYLNPLHYLIMLYRECIVVGTVPVKYFIVFSFISLTTFWLGHYVFSRFKEIFVEHV